MMNRKKKYVDSIDTSHDVIAYLMITMNYISAKELIKLNNYIEKKFRQETKSISKKTKDIVICKINIGTATISNPL